MSVRKTAFIIAFVLLCLPLFFYAWRVALRPPRTSLQQQLFPGISYERRIYNEPRPYMAHIVAIDLVKSQAQALVTPIDLQSVEPRHLAMTTSDFLTEFDLQIAVNGSFFYPFEEHTPWDYYPRQNDAAIALGENISNGDRYGKTGSQWNVVCFDRANRVRVALQQQCPDRTVNAVAGRELLIRDGRSIIDYETKAYARTIAVVNRQGDKLWLVVVDGKQPFYSEGITLLEAARLSLELGGDRAVNLDGGGSSTLAIAQNETFEILNAPIHTKIPLRERPIANHLGFAVP